MKNRRLGIIGLLGIGLVLILSSCGGGSGSSKRLTKKQFVAKTNALCASFNAEVKKAGSPATSAQAIVYFDKLLPLYEKRVEGIDKLNPPASEEASVTQIVALDKEQVARVKTLIAAIKKNDLKKTNKLIEEGNASGKQSAALYTKLGIKECAKG